MQQQPETARVRGIRRRDSLSAGRDLRERVGGFVDFVFSLAHGVAEILRRIDAAAQVLRFFAQVIEVALADHVVDHTLKLAGQLADLAHETGDALEQPGQILGTDDQQSDHADHNHFGHA